jgi:hypothetical protein
MSRVISVAAILVVLLGSALTGCPTEAPPQQQEGVPEGAPEGASGESPGQGLGAAKVQLPPPRRSGGMPLMKALDLRQTKRLFSDKQLPMQILSDLLWAASGVNRPESGKRTAPTATDAREIDLYVASERGLYLYDVPGHRLDRVLAGDIRPHTGSQGFVSVVPVDLIFVADETRFEDMSRDDVALYSATDTGYISQNVYLFCASEGLATVAVGSVDRPALAEAMKLRPSQRVILTQPVGYPRE